MRIEPVDAGDRLRIAVLGDFDSVHTQSWLAWFVARGHDVHAISYYRPRATVDGVTLHVLSPDRGATVAPASAGKAGASERLPRGLVRLAHALRYRKAGLARAVREIAPDVFHAHFLVEHGLYGALAGFHPYVVSAWGSDVLVEPQRDVISRQIAKWTLRRADVVTSNNAYMATRIGALGASADKVEVVTLGADGYFLEDGERSVNVRAHDPSRIPVVLSTRAHEPLYNIDEIIQAFGDGRRDAAARLRIAHGGSETNRLRREYAARDGVEFVGQLERAAFRDALHDAEVFVSVPSSDGTSVALLQAMAAGCFPIVSDLATQHELIEDGVNGLLVPVHDRRALATAITRALADEGLRRNAVVLNREVVKSRGLTETQMEKMERIYLRLARRTARRARDGDVR